MSKKNDILWKIKRANPSFHARLIDYTTLIGTDFQSVDHAKAYLFQLTGYLWCIKDLGIITQEELDFLRDYYMNQIKEMANEKP